MLTDILANKGYYIAEQLSEETCLIANKITDEYRVLKKVSNNTNVEILKSISFLRHPKFPRLFDVLEVNDEIYCVIEFIKGKNLVELLNDNKANISLNEKLKLISEICEIVNFLHSQFENPLLHLEITKENILVDTKGNIKFKNFGKMVIWDNFRYKNEIVKNLDKIPSGEISNSKVLDYFTVKDDINMIGRLIQETLTIDNQVLTYSMLENENQLNVNENLKIIIDKTIDIEHEDNYSNVLDIKKEIDTQLKILSESKSTYKITENVNSNRIELDNGKILCVWDDGVFASEISTVLAKHNKSVLLIDANLLSPSVDLQIELKSTANNSIYQRDTNTLSELMDEYANNRLTSKTILNCASKSTQKNLFCICGNYRMEDYEFYSTDGLVSILNESAKVFDFTVVVCSKFIYDEFTCASIISANMLFIPVVANFYNFREYNRYINFLSARKQFNRVEIAFVGKDYSSQDDYSAGICDELCSGNFKGVISKSEKRRTMEGSDKKYTLAMENKIIKQYINVLSNSGIKI